MKNIIKKILRESDFDWVDDIPEEDFSKRNHYYIIDLIGSTKKERCSVQDFLINTLNFRWSDGKKEVRVEYCGQDYLAYVIENRELGYLTITPNRFIKKWNLKNKSTIINFKDLLFN